MKDKLLNELLSIPDYQFGKYLLKEDYLYDQIQEKEEIIEESIKTGIEISEKIKADSNMNFDKLLNKLDCKISYEETKNEFNFFELAAFEEPNTIIFYRENLERIDREIERENMDTLKKLDAKKVILAHEIYHKLEEIYHLYTDNVFISYTKLGFIKKKVKLSSPSEIGAMAFAKNILNLKVNPLIINYLLAKSYNKEEVIYNKIIK